MILDTNAISALLEDDEALHARIAGESMLQLPVIAIGEFRFGLLGSRLREPLAEKLAALIRGSVVLEVTEVTTSITRSCGTRSRSPALPIPANDLADRRIGPAARAAHPQPATHTSTRCRGSSGLLGNG